MTVNTFTPFSERRSMNRSTVLLTDRLDSFVTISVGGEAAAIQGLPRFPIRRLSELRERSLRETLAGGTTGTAKSRVSSSFRYGRRRPRAGQALCDRHRLRVEETFSLC